MINQLKFKVTFPNGKTFEGDDTFLPGMTTITGRNGMGKSLRAEFFRYAWFGSDALRGLADDYKKLSVESEATIRGQDFKVVRAGTKAVLSKKVAANWEIIATGTKAVNIKVCETFGYGLGVFDIAHCINQGEIESLGAMRPGERKKMVDQVIGLDVLDSLIEFAGKEYTASNLVAETLAGTLVPPVAPVQPEGYEPANVSYVEVLRLKGLEAERNEIIGALKIERILPREPTTRSLSGDSAADLKIRIDTRAVIKAACDALASKIAVIPDPEYTVEQLDAIEVQIAGYHAWTKYRRALAEMPPRPLGLDVPAVEKQIHDWKRWQAFRRALDELPPKPTLTTEAITAFRQYVHDHTEWTRARFLWETSKNQCPACQHEWSHKGHDKPTEDMVQPEWTLDQLAEEERRVAAWADAPTAPPFPKPEEPRYDDKDLATERFRALAWATPPAEIPEVQAPPFFEEGVTAHRRNLGRVQEKAGLVEQYATQHAALLTFPEDLDEMYQTRVNFDAQFSAYTAAMEEYRVWFDQRAIHQARLGELAEVPNQLAEVSKKHLAAQFYERDVSLYDEAKSKFEALVQRVADAKFKADQYKRSKMALAVLKVKVKNYLIPSLNVVASTLLTQMTGGDFSTVQVDEEFDIRVDGQSIDTLSGGEKAVANLAVRIGLGQVLTNRVFSVLMGDEIDAAVDDDRVGHMAQALHALKTKISQIILVTHKRPVADHYIELEAA